MILALALAIVLNSTEATPNGVECGRPCVIEESGGGYTLGFRLQGLHMLYEKTPIIIDGPCYSSCTLLADVARNVVCITSRALFGYHQMYWDETDGRHYAKLSYETPGLEEYLESRGGQPANSQDVLLVPFEQLKKFYKPCPGAV